MWLILFAVLLALSIGGIVYLLTRMRRFVFIQRLAAKHRLLSWLVCLLPLAAVGCFFFVNGFAVIVALLHLFFIWVFCDLIALAIRKCAKKQRTRYYEGAVAILLTAAVLGCGWYFAHHVVETDYQFTTEKALPDGHLRVGMIADAHIGITLSGPDFAGQMQRLQAAEPEIVFAVGDFVDDDTSREDMLAAAEALGSLQAKYGVYYVFGNHDRGYNQSRDFTAEDLRHAFEQYHVTVLEDESVRVGGCVSVTGRRDKGVNDRLSMQALTETLEPSDYLIVLDHQPNDYENEAAAGADLVLSGHTHGGHIWPAGQVGLLMGANDRIYGTETRGNTTFLVTSGISGWAIPFKTGAVSEYVVIDVTQQ